MTTITRKRISEILRYVFDLLWFEPEGLYLRDIMNHLNQNNKLTDPEKGYFPPIPGFQIFEIILRIGSIPIEKSGWLVKTKWGRWYITPKGRKESKKFSNAEEFFLQAIEYYEDWREAEQAKFEGFDALVRERAEERAWEQIQSYLQNLRPDQLINIIAELFKAMNYYITWTSSADFEESTIHMTASLDPLGINEKRLVVHLSHLGQVTTLEGLHSFVSQLRDNDQGVFISTGGFTKSARNDASINRNSNLSLIDLEKLVELWLLSMNKLPTHAKNLLPLKPIYFLSFSDGVENISPVQSRMPTTLILHDPDHSH